jgi:ABC-type polysaccharide/polyol phosphate transport system ATPase subunit
MRAGSTIQLSDAGVRFQIDRHQRLVTPALARLRRGGTVVWGVRHVDLRLGPGEGVALVGPSGSGKTTLLRLLAGVFSPDEGAVAIGGRVGSLLSIEAGVNGFLTGRENARLLGVLGGLSSRQAVGTLERVKELSGLGEAFERQVATWSQGMRARLGYAVAQVRDPDVLLLDEVHEALDHEFRRQVEAHARRLIERGGLVVAAGHDHELLSGLCRRALWLAHGEVRRDGPFGEVVAAYAA